MTNRVHFRAEISTSTRPTWSVSRFSKARRNLFRRRSPKARCGALYHEQAKLDITEGNVNAGYAITRMAIPAAISTP